MKIIAAIFFAASGCLAADTNHIRFEPISLPLSITNKGKVYPQPITITSIDEDGIVIFSGLHGVRIPFTDLPEPLYSKFWSDTNVVQAVAKARTLKELLKQIHEEQARSTAIAIARARHLKEIEDRVEASATFLNGRILQKVEYGFLISSYPDSSVPKEGPTFDGTAYLQNCSRIAGMADDEKFRAWAYPIGTMVRGQRTLRHFTLEKDLAVQMAINAEKP